MGERTAAHTAKCVDEIALVKTVFTNAINHDPACTFVMTGSEVPGKASLGSWLAYGLGSESQNLPHSSYSHRRGQRKRRPSAIHSHVEQWFFCRRDSVVLLCAVSAIPVLYIQNPPGVSKDADRRTMLDTLNQLNQQSYAELGDPEIQTRIAQYEWRFACRIACLTW